MAILFEKLNLSSQTLPNNIVFSNDLKLGNIVLGLMSHASSFPCCWCEVEKNRLQMCGKLRTFGSIRKNYEGWCESGKHQEDAKYFKNCVNNPIISELDETLVLDKFPPPELHLLLGVVNKVFECLERMFPEISLEWAKFCNVQKELMHGGTFNGNSSRKLLKNVSFLEENLPLTFLLFAEVFNSFNIVVSSCFGKTLDENAAQHIETFKNNYLQLCSLTNQKLSVTPKVHAVFHHILDFCTKADTGLGPWSEQASESVHSDFKMVWNRFKRTTSDPHYGKWLQRAVCEYNSNHI